MQYLSSLYSNSAIATSFANTNGFMSTINASSKPEDSALALQLLVGNAGRNLSNSSNTSASKTSNEDLNSNLSKLAASIRQNSFTNTSQKELQNRVGLQTSDEGSNSMSINANAVSAMLRALAATPGVADLSGLGLGGTGVNGGHTSMSAATQAAAAAAMLQLTYASSLQNQLNISHANNMQSKVGFQHN